MTINRILFYLKKPKVYVLAILLIITLTTVVFSRFVQDFRIRAAGKVSCAQSEKQLFETKPNKDLARANAGVVKEENSALKDMSDNLRNPISNTDDFKSAIAGLSDKRKKTLLDVARTDPQQAYSLLLDQSIHDTLDLVTDNCIEQPVSVEGQLVTRHVDFFKDDVSKDGVFLVQTDGTELELHPTVMNDKFISGTNVQINGYKLDDDVIFDSANPDNMKDMKKNHSFIPKAQARVDSSFGDQKLLVLLANFSNTTPPIDKTTVDTTVFTTVNNFYKENSYASVSLSGTTLDWRKMPIASTCDSKTIRNYALSTFDPYVDFRNYKRVMVIAPFTFQGCGFQGEQVGSQSFNYDGGVTLSGTVVAAEAANSLYIPAHELGHDFGVGHASFNGIDYGDSYDLMGRNTGNHMDAPHKIDIGWLAGSRVVIVSQSGKWILEPIESQTTGLKSLKVPSPSGGYVYVEYRQPIGFDSNFVTVLPNTDVYVGALLHTYESNCYQCHSYLIHANGGTDPATSALRVGESYRIPGSSTLIKVTGRSSNALGVEVWLNGVAPITSPPPTPIPTTAPVVLYTKPYSSTTGLTTTTANGYKNTLIQVKKPISLSYLSLYNTGCGHSFEVRKSSTLGELTGTVIVSGTLGSTKNSLNYCERSFTKTALAIGYYVMRVYVGTGEAASYYGTTISSLSDVTFYYQSQGTANANKVGAFMYRIGYTRNY